MDSPEGISKRAASFARRLRALEEGTIRARAAARAIEALEPGEAADLLAALLRSRSGEAAAVLAAVGQALLDPEGGVRYQQLAALYQEASERGMEEVTGLLLSPAPQCAWKDPADKPDPRLARLSLGHKKSMARAHRDPDLLARLAAEGEPVVVRELLRNPQLTEEFAVRIAARRPCRPETLRCLYQDRRWRTRAPVALALARNPYLETAIGLKILPTLGSRDLSEIAEDGSLHPLMRAMAAKLVSGFEKGPGRGGRGR